MFLFGQSLCGFFTLIQQGGLAGSSFHLGTKKEAWHLARPLKCVLSLWEQDQLDYEQREKHHEEQKTLMSALIAVISDQSSESHSGFQESVSSPEIITTPGTIQNAPKIPATFLGVRTAKKPATKPNASQEQ